jgi:hypothetical protein
MKYFKLFEQFVTEELKNVNESKFYTLQDMIDDNKSERDIQKAIAMCAVTLGLNPDGVAIVTTEDDDYDQYSKKYKSAKFKKFDNPSADMETAHSETDNIIMFNDGSVSGYMIPVERMDESNTVAIVEASNVYSKAASELFMNVAEILKHYMLDDEYDYNEFKPGIKKIRNQEDLTKWYENMIKDLKDVYEDEGDNEAIKAIVKESPAIAKKAGVTLNSIKESKELNEAKISYSLEDLMGDVTDKDYIKMCELIARTIGEKPKDIAVITSEDDEFGKYQARFRNNPTAAINNPSSETSTYYDKKSNVVTGNDGSTITYFIPAKQLLENFVNEAKAPKINAIDFNKLKKMMLDASDMDLNDERDFDDTIKILKKMSDEFAKGEESFSKLSYNQDISGISLDGDAEDLDDNPKLAKAASDLEDLLGMFDSIQSGGNAIKSYVKTYNEIADVVNSYKK